MSFQPFVQPEPRPRHGFRDDWLVRSFVRYRLPPEVAGAIEPELDELGTRASGPLWDFQRADRLNEPRLTSFDAWGKRIDHIELTPLWREAEPLAVNYGLTAHPQERRYGSWSRLHQFLLVHLFHPVTDVYTCPLDPDRVMSVGECVRQIVVATRRRSRELVMTPTGKLAQVLKLVAPGFVDRLARRAIERVR